MTPADAPPPKDAIRDAATVIVLRQDGPAPSVLMGQRGDKAAFMPSKFVFPGGSVDASDAAVAALHPLPDPLATALAARAHADLGPALAMAAIRELWEETGLRLTRPGAWTAPAPGPWAALAAAGEVPAPDALSLIFRAITPPGRPRRFDARFFLVPAEALADDPDDFSRADGELAFLHWVPVADARALDLPFITEVVLAEVQARLTGAHQAGVPFFHHAAAKSFIEML